MRVINWTSLNNREFAKIGLSDIGGHDIANAVIDEMKRNGYRFSGTYHQYGKYGAPVIDCYPVIAHPVILSCSMREWGRIMAKVMNLDESDALAYTNWDCVDSEPPVYPTF